MFEGIELFSSLSNEEIKTLEMFCQQRDYKAGEILFNIGDEASAMYIVKSGLLEAYNYDKILGTISPGGFVGEMALFLIPKIRTASVKAVENSTVITLLSFSINELLKKHPEIFEKIKGVIEQRNEQNLT
ncbi:MAG: cyclic nucleotide-binding domain-containing protein [Candidatus Gracilibacteria bacterium]|nr:cyclic nucleotide-binding domain-containing protein [Candidatus Gracilibacteria bacterium]